MDDEKYLGEGLVILPPTPPPFLPEEVFLSQGYYFDTLLDQFGLQFGKHGQPQLPSTELCSLLFSLPQLTSPPMANPSVTALLVS